MFDVIIIGAGPAGLNAAIYASRGNLKVAILEKETPGGKIVKTANIENWIGFKSVTGPDLAMQMYEHALSFGAEYLYGNVIDIIDEGKVKKIVTEDETYECLSVVIATGTKERKINIPGEEELYGRGVSYCAVCDGALFKDKVQVVVGGGNSALEEALYLTRFASIVYLVHRRNEYRAEKHIVDEVRNNKKIKEILNTVPLSINGKSQVESITLKNNETGEVSTIETPVVFMFVGLDPVTNFVSKLGICNEKGYIVANDKMETSVKGIYSAGDVNEKNLRQIVTACNDGAIAANQVIGYIQQIKND